MEDNPEPSNGCYVLNDLPDKVYRIIFEFLIRSYDRQLLNLSLSDQHSVEGVAMRARKGTRCQCMFHSNL